MPEIRRRVVPDDRFVLTLDGVVCREVIAAEGGDISAPVIREPDASGLVRKHLGPPAPQPIELALDLSLQPLVYEWIDAFWQGKVSAKDGTLISVDATLRAKGKLLFERAVIDATSFPTADATLSDPAHLAVTLRPERTSLAPGSGEPVPGLAPKKQLSGRASNFRLQIDGLDCTRVSKVEAGLITRSADATDLPDLSITLAASASEQWRAWHEEFVEKGQNDAAHEKTGTLTFVKPDMKSQLAGVTLSGLGIYRVAPETTAEKSRNTINRVVAEVYCQQMELFVGGF